MLPLPTLNECKQLIIELQDVLDTLKLPSPINKDDYNDLLETSAILIQDLIQTEPMLYISPKFHEILHSNVSELLEEQLSEVYDYDISDIIKEVVDIGISMYYTYISPKRSYKRSFIRNTSINKQTMTNKIEYLKNIPQPEQRTKEWYEFRYKFLTASSIWKAFISDSSRNQLIYDKCTPLNTDKYKSFSTESPMHWGTRYEPVSIMLYERDYNTLVSDFGCIPHRTISFLAASPDGINTYINSERYGRMLEVKNIVNREITGIPKMEYWIQMQIQMEVCELNECDFLETRFIEYEDFEEFEKDGDFTHTLDKKQKGIIMYFIKDGQPHYEYAPIGISKSEFDVWENDIMTKNNSITWMKNLYWKLDQLSCVLVLRNKMWFKAAVPILENVWNIIEKEKISGYEHRSPKRNNRKKHKNQFDSEDNALLKTETQQMCYIDINKLLNIDLSTNNQMIESSIVNNIDDANQNLNISTECLSNTMDIVLTNQIQDP
jgi:putative phage-type endonuclease